MAKKLRLKGPVETNKCIVEMALKRWQTYEGDYCDDVRAWEALHAGGKPSSLTI